MIIKELQLINFGKFTNKKILLDDHLNIIFGENEAGKSTVFHFIVGMFFGFYKPYVKNRRLLEIHETYKPWSGGGYLGNLIFYDEETKQTLKIERNFDQKNESINVIDISSGKDITDIYPLHPVFRLPDIAGVHLGVSYTTFVNTLAIKQLGHETDDNLDKELEETVVNALSTRNLDVSVNKVQERITSELNAIGTNRKKTSNFYLKNQQLSKLNIELDEAKEIHQELIKLKDEEADLISLKVVIKEQLNEIDLITKANLWQELSELIEEVNRLEVEKLKQKRSQEELKVTGEFSVLEIDKTMESIIQLDFHKQRYKEKDQELDLMRNEINELKNNMVQPVDSISREKMEQLIKDLYQFEQLEYSKTNRDHRIVELRDKLKENRIQKESQEAHKLELLAKKKRYNLFIIGGGLILLFSLLFILVLKSQFYGMFFAGVIGFAGIIYGVISILSLKNAFTELGRIGLSIEKEIGNLNDEIVSLDKEKNRLTREVEGICTKYDIEDYPSLSIIKDKWNQKNMEALSLKQVYEHQSTLMIRLQERIKEQKDLVADINDTIENTKSEILPVTSYYQSESVSDFRRIKERLMKHQEFGKSIENFNQRQKDILINRSLNQVILEKESLLKDIISSSFQLTENSEEIDVKNIIKTIIENGKIRNESKEEIYNRFHTIEQKLVALKTKVDTLFKDQRSLVEIEEEISAIMDEITGMEFRKKVYETIKDTIEGITDELKHNFAPLLNDTVSAMVKEVTEEKYSDIKINPEMLMRLVDPKSNRTIGAQQLSRGTVDLFYIALREALANWVNSDKRLPLLMDESFAHFDDKRLKIILRLFTKQPRQILLFTCQQREIDLLMDHTTIIYL